MAGTLASPTRRICPISHALLAMSARPCQNQSETTQPTKSIGVDIALRFRNAETTFICQEDTPDTPLPTEVAGPIVRDEEVWLIKRGRR